MTAGRESVPVNRAGYVQALLDSMAVELLRDPAANHSAFPFASVGPVVFDFSGGGIAVMRVAIPLMSVEHDPNDPRWRVG